MAFKMLIVDDEPIIRKGLEQTIPWNDYNIEVVDSASDGDEAINKINEYENINLVITDVKMPNKDGLELAEFITSNYPSIRIIMISGYDEFTYAQQAMVLGVKHYLLKPVDVDELLKVVNKITEQIKEESIEMQHAYLTNLANTIYNRLFDNTGKPGDGLENLSVYPFISMVQNYGKIADSLLPLQLEEVKQSWREFIQSELKKAGLSSISIFTGENILFTCVVNGDKNSIESIPFHLTERREPEFFLSYVFNGFKIPIKRLNSCYSELKDQTKFLPLQTSNIIIGRISELLIYYPDGNLEEFKQHFAEAILQNNQEEVNEQISKLFHYFTTKKIILEETANECSIIIEYLIGRISNLLGETSAVIQLHYNKHINVEIYNSYELLKELFTQDISKIMNQYGIEELNRKDWIIERAENYIKSYYKSELRAQEVADVVNISPNYFSSLFKQRTGKGFSEYLNELRIEDAKQLLEETPFKVNEIAEQVGYQEYKYFVEIFKRITGVTPTKYRKMRTSNNK